MPRRSSWEAFRDPALRALEMHEVGSGMREARAIDASERMDAIERRVSEAPPLREAVARIRTPAPGTRLVRHGWANREGRERAAVEASAFAVMRDERVIVASPDEASAREHAERVERYLAEHGVDVTGTLSGTWNDEMPQNPQPLARIISPPATLSDTPAGEHHDDRPRHRRAIVRLLITATRCYKAKYDADPPVGDNDVPIAHHLDRVLADSRIKLKHSTRRAVMEALEGTQ